MTSKYREKNQIDFSQGESQTPGQDTRWFSNLITSIRGLVLTQGQYSPMRILIITIVSIILAEAIAMLVIYNFQFLPYLSQVILDIIIMTVIISPSLYLLTFRPLHQHLQQQRQSESIIKTRLHLMQFANTHTLNELLQMTLDELETLTGSTIGFFHFLEADQNMIWLQAWSTNTLQNMCNAEGEGSHYEVEKAGVWADCIRQRRPVIHNDYASLKDRKGMPEGHATVVREMAIPIIRSNKVVAILGLGNKPEDYTSRDQDLVSTLADFAWDIVERKRVELNLLESEEKFHNLVDWTYDWEKWLDPEENIVYSSPSCERITGFTPAEFIADKDLLKRIVHPDDKQLFLEHHRVIHDESAGPVSIEYRIIARDGSEHWIEHVCRPLFESGNRYLGRRVSNRDISERKQAEKENQEHNQKEGILTQSIRTIQTDIARDLHDTLGQNIGFLRMTLEHLSESKLQDQVQTQKQIQSMIKAANESYDLIRTMLAVLQPGDPIDPVNLFNRYADQVSERSAFQVAISNHGIPRLLSPQQGRQLFYIFREALSNIEKSAKPGCGPYPMGRKRVVLRDIG